MHAVIGTAGHVDHGKSALIQALTGTHPSHLPQELARGMTIDLGFAHFSTPKGDKIGIIDVPGHERFLRNMVSAIWGLDLVLFVVAADEGWSALSEEHLRVIAALGVKQMLVVLNKCDLVDAARQSEVEETVLEHFLALTDSLPDVMRVSARTGAGIEELKQLIVDKLYHQPPRELLNPQAHLYVDRVFSVNGIGTTVTGTLRGGQVIEGQSLTLYPGGQSVRVKSLQSYHQQLAEVEPFSRVAIGLKQVRKQDVSRGSCLVAQAEAVTTSREWIVQLRPEFSRMKKQSEVEVALGTSHTQARCFVFADGRLARLQLKEAIPAFWGQPLLIILHGGSRIIGAGRLVWMQTLDKTRRQILLETLSTLQIDSDPQAELNLRLALAGYAPQNDNATPAGVHALGPWWVRDDCYQRVLDQSNQVLLAAISAVSAEELSSRTGYPVSLIQGIASAECDAGRWGRIEGGLVSTTARQDGSLPPEQQMLLDKIEAAGEQGFDSGKESQTGILKLLRALVERDLIVPMEDKMFFARAAYQSQLEKILSGRAPGETFAIADARDCTGLARKQLIPLLNRMERDGWVKRQGDQRVVNRALR